MKRLYVAIAALVLPVLAVGMFQAAPSAARMGVKTYEASLASLNNSGVSGTAMLSLEGDQLTVHVEASGLELNRLHMQHIHGFVDDHNATCPGPSADSNGDGIISFAEGLPYFGPVLLGLEPYPMAEDGTINYEHTFTVDPESIGPLQNRAIVVHGLTVNGAYTASVPVACGQVRVEPQTGQP